MSRLTAFIFFSIFFLLPALLHAQEQTERGVIIHADPRLAILLKKLVVVRNEPVSARMPERETTEVIVDNTPVVTRTPVVLYSGKGFRVQVYSGADRAQAMSIKNDLMRRYPGVRTYITFIAPSFRVKVGDYRSRALAEGMLKQVNTIYHPCMIVPDEITITGYQ